MNRCMLAVIAAVAADVDVRVRPQHHFRFDIRRTDVRQSAIVPVEWERVHLSSSVFCGYMSFVASSL